MIWTEAILNQYVSDAYVDISNQISFLFHRFYLATINGTAAYVLPDKVKTIKKITWRGKKVDPITWIEMQDLLFRYDQVNQKYPAGPPRFYAINPVNSKGITFFPTPNETLSASGGNPYECLSNESRCTISCWRYVDESDPKASLPNYISRRLTKSFVLWQAFAKEGKGQNLKASDYYLAKYTFLINIFKQINDGVFVSKRYGLGDGSKQLNQRPPRPTLGPNFERVNYRR